MINGTYLEAFGYYDVVDAYPEVAHKSVQEMVTEYRKVAGQPLGMSDEELLQNLEPLALAWNLIEEEWKELYAETDTTLGYREDLALKEFADLVYVLYGYCSLRGWDLDEAVRRVHKNNMDRMYQPDGTIKRREDGKIEKNPNTPKVNLEDLV